MTYELDKCGFSHGDLLVFKTPLYTHWAVYAGYDTLIHYNTGDAETKKSNAIIMEESLQEYRRHSNAPGDKLPEKEPSLGILERRLFPEKFTADEIVKRAREHVGKGKYNLFLRNCETFAKWCKYGVMMSEQVQKIGLAITANSGAGAGAGAGALIGAGIGSVVPGVGTAIGAGAGLVSGLIIGAFSGGPGVWAVNQIIRRKKRVL